MISREALERVLRANKIEYRIVEPIGVHVGADTARKAEEMARLSADGVAIILPAQTVVDLLAETGVLFRQHMSDEN